MAIEKTAYNRERERYLRIVRKYAKYGYKPIYDAPLTEAQLRKTGASDKEIIYETNRMKEFIENLGEYGDYWNDVFTGETLTSDEVKKVVKAIQNETKKYNKNLDYTQLEFESNINYFRTPDFFGEREAHNTANSPIAEEVYYENAYDEFMTRLSEDIPETYLKNGKTVSRRPEAIQASKNARNNLMSFLESEVARRGKASVGASIQLYIDANGYDALDSALSSNYEENVYSALYAIREAIGGAFTQQDQKNLSEEGDYYESYTYGADIDSSYGLF